MTGELRNLSVLEALELGCENYMSVIVSLKDEMGCLKGFD
jgi:hypothetical protein